MATESALTLTANDISASEQAELNRWFDKLAQNAPEDVQMTGKLRNWQREILQRASDNRGVVLTTRIDGDKSRPMDNRARVLVGHGWLKYVSFDECQSAYELTDAGRAALAADTAASEPAYNPATGWITKTEAEARAEFEDGWNAAERENFVSVVDFSKQSPSIGDNMEYYKAQLTDALKDVRNLQAELKTEKTISTAAITDLEAARKENERLQAELKRVNFFRDRDLAAHIDRVSALAGERDAIKADIAVVLCDLEAIATGMTGDYTPAGIANIAISRLAIYK